MRRVVQSTRVSLDGVIGNLQEWGMAYFDSDAQTAAVEQLENSDAMLMGRNTYQALAAGWSSREGEFADRINAIRKYVFSSTLTEVEWSNATLVDGDLVAEVGKLKEQDGGDLLVYGQGPVGQALLEHGLLDEIRLSVHPVLVGRGTLFFREGLAARLELIDSRALKSGVVVLTYAPVGRPGADAPR
jgi:dihydrofolate reductase